jgi:predicted CoA-binding protein
MDPMHSDDDLHAMLAAARIAVLGAHPDPAKPASYVPSYLHERTRTTATVVAVFLNGVVHGQTWLDLLSAGPCLSLDWSPR